MNEQAANELVRTWATERALPENLKGRALTLVDFESDADCGFFYPGRTRQSHKAFTSTLARFARARQARTEHITINQEHYRHWLAAEKVEDTEPHRNRFIESRYKVLPLD